MHFSVSKLYYLFEIQIGKCPSPNTVDHKKTLYHSHISLYITLRTCVQTRPSRQESGGLNRVNEPNQEQR